MFAFASVKQKTKNENKKFGTSSRQPRQRNGKKRGEARKIKRHDPERRAPVSTSFAGKLFKSLTGLYLP